MKKIYSRLLGVLLLCSSLVLNAQIRYLDDVFTEVKVTSDVIYGSNIGIITQAPALEDLKMDIYEPVGDTESNRPVVIMLHTGSFLPKIANGQPTGDKTDNAIVEACERFAKKGYVAVAMNYRLGWNPVSPSEDVRRSTLIQAAYRGLQDVKTAVRFLRKSVGEGNTYGVGDKFAVGGNGTGGYLALATATLNDYQSELLMPKFIDDSEETVAAYGQAVPYIVQSQLGNFEATDYGYHPTIDLNSDGVFEDVPLCVPNHVGYSSEVDMVFNAGGALPDKSWLEAGEVPIASMHVIADPDAPYAEGPVIVPTTGEFVITAHGSKLVQEIAHSLGNNDVFAGLTTTLTDATYNNGSGADNAASAGHDDYPGLFGIVLDELSTTPTPCGMPTVSGAPWDWWDNAAYDAAAGAYQGQPAGVMGCLATLSNLDMSETKGKNYANMMSEFFTPRVYAALIGKKRYLDDVFTEVKVTSDVIYGSNIGIITQAPALEDLKMDIYEPVGDTESNRPVVIMLHTGSFLPKIANGQPTGDKTDNAIVEACERFAKKGYVAVAMNYRLGWNPVSPSEDVRRSTLIQAAYRGLQDVKTAVRFLRKSVGEGNTYGVGDKFAVGGNGTGGYLALATATLNDYQSELLMPKFIDDSEETVAAYGQAVPYIVQSQLGNFEATDYGYHPTIDLNSDGVFEDVPLCVPNHVGYSSEVDMVFNAGGALPDKSWLEAGEVPIASMHVIADPDAPYAEGPVIVPTTGEFVITAHGSKLVQEIAHSLGNNDVFAGLTTTLTDATYNNGSGADNAASAGHDDYPGLFGIVLDELSTTPTPCGMPTVSGAPWDWWDNAAYDAAAGAYQGQPAGVMGCLATLSNLDMSETKGKNYANMMSEFFTPRVYAALIEGKIFGCTNPSAENYNPQAHSDDGSCTIRGCTNPSADNYDWQANTDDGSCVITACPYPQYFEYDSNYTTADAFLCQTYIIEGCTDYQAENFNSQANKDDGSCVVEGCMNPSADNYNAVATYQDGTSCLIYGCTNSNAENYQSEATYDNGSCVIGGCTLIDFANYNPAATYDDGSCDPSSAIIYGCTDSLAVNYKPNATLDNGFCEFSTDTEAFEMYMPQGWSMFGYTCWASMDVAEAFAGMEDQIVIVKDGAGNPYLPEYGYNGLGNLEYARGYQLKTTEEIKGFTFCSVEGADQSRTYQVGDYTQGGIVFYVDETGQHGLVAALSDLTEGASNPNDFGYMGYEWGCYGEDVNGADGVSVGTGYKNTVDIVEQGCNTEHGGVTAAQASLSTSIAGFEDWYLPSLAELVQMCKVLDEYTGNFQSENAYYWSSTEGNRNFAWYIDFVYDLTVFGSDSDGKNVEGKVRPVRSF